MGHTRATLTRPPLDEGAIIVPERAEGYIFTPTLPDSNKRVLLLIDERDIADIDSLLRGEAERATVNDLLTDDFFTIKRDSYDGAEIVL